MALVGLTVAECASAFLQSIHYPLVDEHSSDRDMATSQSFAECLDIWCKANLRSLPRMHSASPAYTRHDFVHDEQGSMLLADFLHSCKIAWYRWDTAQSLSPFSHCYY